MTLPLTLHDNLELLLKGDTATIPITDILLALGRSRARGVLHLEPSGLRFHVRDGYLDAVEGVEPLGSLLLRMGLVKLKDLQGLELLEPIGLTLMQKGKLELYDLWQALGQQARMGLAKLQGLTPQTYIFFPHEPLVGPVANLGIQKTLFEIILAPVAR